MKNKINLADKKAAYELLKQLYTVDEVKDDAKENNDSNGESRAKSTGEVVEPSSHFE